MRDSKHNWMEDNTKEETTRREMKLPHGTGMQKKGNKKVERMGSRRDRGKRTEMGADKKREG